jgi:hypothetical protein
LDIPNTNNSFDVLNEELENPTGEPEKENMGPPNPNNINSENDAHILTETHPGTTSQPQETAQNNTREEVLAIQC